MAAREVEPLPNAISSSDRKVEVAGKRRPFDLRARLLDPLDFHPEYPRVEGASLRIFGQRAFNDATDRLGQRSFLQGDAEVVVALQLATHEAENRYRRERIAVPATGVGAIVRSPRGVSGGPRVNERPACDRHPGITIIEHFGDAVVGDLRYPVVRHHDVSGVQIAMDKITRHLSVLDRVE